MPLQSAALSFASCHTTHPASHSPTDPPPPTAPSPPHHPSVPPPTNPHTPSTPSATLTLPNLPLCPRPLFPVPRIPLLPATPDLANDTACTHSASPTSRSNQAAECGSYDHAADRPPYTSFAACGTPRTEPPSN